VTALVTGAAGFLGAAVVHRLLARGQRRLRLFVRPGSARARLDAVISGFPEAEVSVVTGTLLSTDDCRRAVDGAGIVYHVAAGTTGTAADLFLHTVVASSRLLAAMAATGARPRGVLVSSLGVYGAAALHRGALLDETAPLESEPARRDAYSHAKLRQEALFREYERRDGLPLVVLRPGVIYGPGRARAVSSRVGIALGGVFLHLGGANLLPLTYVDNCAEAVVVAGTHPEAQGHAFNVVDDDLPTCSAYLRRYRREVSRVRVLRLPYPATVAVAGALERYHRWSQGQLPAVLTRYKVRTTWGGNTFSNDRLKALGWRPLISTEEGLRRTFLAAAGLPPGA
jgi:2-alkyl-3-oxoalkanoate reductase